jgi:hypothetical protein
MRLLLTFLALTGASAFIEGDSCGVKSSDFFIGSFVGDYLVAGAEGCTLDDGMLCASNQGILSMLLRTLLTD